jgi:hypothetical protein
MRSYHSCFFAAAIALALASSAEAQVPVVPVAPVAPAHVGFWGTLSASCKAKRAAICNGPLGRLLKNALRPLSALTGGLVPGQVGPSQQELAAPGSVGAAAKIQADLKEAGKRRDAVRFLGTIDCHWYPEAEAGLVAALRIDRSECVRYEAARSLSRGCCCTKTTIEALSICVAGDDRDGNPAENSLRVQLMALEALSRCIGSYQGEAEEPLPRPEHPASAKDEIGELPPVHFSAYYAKIRAASRDEVLQSASRVVAAASQRQVKLPASPRRSGSVLEIWSDTEN